ncbi:hypothetical protein ASE68_03130 [Agromyces sp. Leaf222]|nr:hypothetical protein ASE68_03130 [Agromyces sp. Leaf222]
MDGRSASFAASTPGKADSTLTLWISADEVAEMQPGQVTYSTMQDGSASFPTSYEKFERLSCDPFE